MTITRPSPENGVLGKPLNRPSDWSYQMAMRPSPAITAVAVLAFLLASASAEDVHKWRTPDGRIFFGDKPPEGSVDLGRVDGSREPKRGRVLTDADVAADEARATAPEPEAAAPIEAPRGKVLTNREVAADEAAAAPAPTAEPTISAPEARRVALAGAVHIVASSAKRGPSSWKLTGSVENSAPETVHGVEIGAAGAWKRTDPADIAPGEFATFAFEVPLEGGAGKASPPDVEVRWKEQ